ncbi:hypothetical protein F4813DRAFT_285917 [Daldinia decipiens]|uniref:uncharacterized protein n=1 Tax=Daldinia decipiens TaxID=326647 RepID=UPI0020C563D8|nr:uncharacterized protein F4813DRAFT_285917 [Daldinia decipiens]KAI1653002.1 hypothetical protein F4813DRAFT_285917 [Daldinia decipiens]
MILSDWSLLLTKMELRAQFACVTCRRLKRKCPKELPSCSLCLRLEKQCEYPPRVRNLYENTAINSSTSSQDTNKGADHQTLINTPTEPGFSPEQDAVLGHKDIHTFPAIFFLDAEVCTKPLASEPCQVRGFITPHCSLSQEADAICEKYFSTVHQWLPILSKKCARRHIAENELVPDCPSQLLFLCMKLVSGPLPAEVSARANIPYRRALETLLKVENSCLPSLQLLQSVILLSAYELGHAIYPAAYLRVGHAARLCVMMGFHDRKNASQLFKDAVTWTSREEERRTWWAVFCLDRITNQGISGLPFSAPEPSPGELLPCPEGPWIEGEVGFNEPIFATSFSNNTSLGSFANVCQAAHVLGRVLRHRDEPHSSRISLGFRVSEARQLHHILTSLSSHLSDISQESLLFDNSTVVPLALCFSARLILYDIYACNETYSTDYGRSSEEAELQKESMAGIFDVTRGIWQLACQLLDSINQTGGGGLKNLGPFLCHCLYAGASESEWLILEHEDSTAGIWLKDIVMLLRVIGKRWQVADVYLSQIYKWPGYNSLGML